MAAVVVGCAGGGGQPGVERDPVALVEVMAGMRVTIAQFVPTVCGVGGGGAAVVGCSALRVVFCGGEALPAELAAP